MAMYRVCIYVYIVGRCVYVYIYIYIYRRAGRPRAHRAAHRGEDDVRIGDKHDYDNAHKTITTNNTNNTSNDNHTTTTTNNNNHDNYYD